MPKTVFSFVKTHYARLGYGGSGRCIPPNIKKRLDKMTAAEKEEVGCFGNGNRRLVFDEPKFLAWLLENYPGPYIDFDLIPADWDREAFLENANGIYPLRKVMNLLKVRCFSFYTVLRERDWDAIGLVENRRGTKGVKCPFWIERYYNVREYQGTIRTLAN